MKLDTNRAWQEATAMVSANRDVLFALAGVFFILPSLALALLFPTPEISPDAAPRAMFAMLAEHFRAVAPWQILGVIVTALGVLSLLALITDRQRPTVGAAIGEGLRGLPTYIGTTLISVAVVVTVFLLVLLIAAASGSTILGILLGLPALIAVIYVSFRWNLAVPVIAVERERNPIGALHRSWKLTEGNVGRIFLFLFLLGLVYLVILLISAAVISGGTALAFGAEAGRYAGSAVGAVLGGIFSVYVTASLAAIHRQLSGAAEETAQRFD